MTRDNTITTNKEREEFPTVEASALDNLWFQVSGTLCNIRCSHCFISASPTNRSFGFMTAMSWMVGEHSVAVKRYRKGRWSDRKRLCRHK